MDIALYEELIVLLRSIDAQIEEVRELSLEMGCGVTQVRTGNGEFMLTPLLLAKSQTLMAMSILNTT